MENPINIYLGLCKSPVGMCPLYTTGFLVRWYEIIAIVGAVYAISQFIESTKFRAFIFRSGNVSKDVFQLMILSIITVVAANILPLFKIDLNFAIPLLDYPAFWEGISLIAFTVSMVLFLAFSLFPRKFVPKIDKRNSERFYWNIYNSILNDTSDENLAAVASIVFENLDIICQYASKYDSWWDVQGSELKSPFERSKVPLSQQGLVINSMHLIDRVLSTREFCRYLSRNNIGFILKIVDVAERFPNHCGSVFFDSLCKEMFFDSESHLSKELEYRGQGLDKPVYNALFQSLGLVDAYRLFDVVSFFKNENLKQEIVEKYIEALKISLKEFFQSFEGYGVCGPGTSLDYAVEKLPWVLRLILPKINKINKDDIYDNQFTGIVKAVLSFYDQRNLGELLTIEVKERKVVNEAELFKIMPLRYKILRLWQKFKFSFKFSRNKLNTNIGRQLIPIINPEKIIREHSVLEGITKSIFETLNAISLLKDDDYARSLIMMDLYWLLFPWGSKKDKILKIEEKLLEYIKEKIEEGKKINHVPLIKLLINIFGCRFGNDKVENSKIGNYVETEFKSYFAEIILSDESKVKEFLPNYCSIDKEKGIIGGPYGQVWYNKYEKEGACQI